MVDTARALKMADRVKVIVAEMLETRVKDPRLGFITVTDARMTGLRHALMSFAFDVVIIAVTVNVVAGLST